MKCVKQTSKFGDALFDRDFKCKYEEVSDKKCALFQF